MEMSIGHGGFGRDGVGTLAKRMGREETTSLGYEDVDTS